MNKLTTIDVYDFDFEDIDSDYTPPTPTVDHNNIDDELFNKALNNAKVEINNAQFVVKINFNDLKKSVEDDTAVLSVLKSSDTAKEYYKQGDVDELQFIDQIVKEFLKTENAHISIVD